MQGISLKLFERLRFQMQIQPRTRPFVTLSFAQSLDGCLATGPGCHTSISCIDSLTLTHQLRREHDSILVGIDTVISDDPQLTVRLVDGQDPRPVILDSMLRIPLKSRLVQGSAERLTIFTSQMADQEKRADLEKLGVKVHVLASCKQGLDLNLMLKQLKQDGSHSIMIEGGGRIISSFLAEQLVDFLVITIAPLLLGSQSAVRYQASTLGTAIRVPELVQLGRDIVTWGQPSWPLERQFFESVAGAKG